MEQSDWINEPLERAKYHLSVKSVNLRNDESLPNDPYIYES